MKTIGNLLSRKFLVTMTVLVSTIGGLNIDPVRAAIIALVATVYVVSEAVLDRLGMPTSVASDAAKAVTVGIQVARRASAEAEVGVASNGPPTSEFFDIDRHGPQTLAGTGIEGKVR